LTVTRIVFRCRIGSVEGSKTPSKACDLPNKLHIASLIRLRSLCMPLIPSFSVERVAVSFCQIDGVRVKSFFRSLQHLRIAECLRMAQRCHIILGVVRCSSSLQL